MSLESCVGRGLTVAVLLAVSTVGPTAGPAMATPCPDGIFRSAVPRQPGRRGRRRGPGRGRVRHQRRGDRSIPALGGAVPDDLASCRILRDGVPVGTIAATALPGVPGRPRAARHHVPLHRAATDSCGTSTADSNAVTVHSPAYPQTLFGGAPPPHAVSDDTTPVELGVRFQADVAGIVSAALLPRRGHDPVPGQPLDR